MLLCDSHFQVIGISKDTADLLGYDNQDDILGCNIYNLLTKKGSNFINFTPFINSDTPIECKIKHNGLEANILINEFFLKNLKDVAYEIEVLANVVDSIEDNQVKQSDDEDLKTEEIQEGLSQNSDTDMKIDSNWLMQSIEDLQMDPMDFYNFLQSFLQDANEKVEVLQEAIIFKDYGVINETLHELRDSAILLNIEPVLNTLEAMKDSYSDEIFDHFKEFKGVLDQISKFKIEGNENEVKHN